MSLQEEKNLSTERKIKVNYENPNRPTVSGRELHEGLEVETRYNDWFTRMCEYGFEEDRETFRLLLLA